MWFIYYHTSVFMQYLFSISIKFIKGLDYSVIMSQYTYNTTVWLRQSDKMLYRQQNSSSDVSSNEKSGPLMNWNIDNI